MSEYIVKVEGQKPDAIYERELTEIVRCRDCKHGYKAGLSDNWYECMKPDGNGDYTRWDVESNGFCAWGERRSE